MSQTAFDYKVINAAGSASLASRGGGILGKAIMMTSAIGTVKIYDNPSGTSSALIATLGTVTGPAIVQYNLTPHSGLYYVATGTPDVLLTFI